MNRMSGNPDQQSAGELRAWHLAAERVRRIEAAWDDPGKRLRGILACKRWMEQQEHVPRLVRLAALLDPEMDRRRFWTVLVPIERADIRARVTDSAILDRDPGPEAAAPRRMPLTVVADNLRSAFNVGGLFRTADGLGAADLWLCGYTAAPSHPHVAAAAMGTAANLPWRTFERVADALAELRQHGVWTVALETVAHTPCVGEIPWRFPCAVVLGNERFGLDPGTVAACDGTARIPAYGTKNSLNVVTAFAICAWDARRVWNQGV